MERQSFNASPFETSGTEPDDSEKKEKDSSKKKSKRGREPAPPVADEKKEQAVERTKNLLDKLIRPDQKPGEGKTPEQPEAVAASSKVDGSTERKAEASGEARDNDVETLTRDEQAEVIAAYVPARIAELKAGRNEAEDPADAVAREADIEYLQSLIPKSEAGELDAEPGTEGDAELAEKAVDADEIEVAQEFTDDEPVPVSTSRPTRSSGPTTPRPTTPPPAATGSAGSGRGGAVPPVPPVPFGSGPAMPVPSHPNTLPTLTPLHHEYVPDYRQNPNATYLLVGGIVGYLIGRRRGRIKTEKRMRVVQRKLEKQVAEIQSQVAQKEIEVQKLARERYWSQKAQAPVEWSRPAAENSPRPISERPIPVPRPEQATAARAASVPERTPRPVEMRPAPEIEGAPAKPEAVSARAETRPVKEFTKAELLETGAKIKVGNTNLKRIFEAKLITESGLKRLVYEHLEHRDIRRGLAREFLAKELSYERDPHLRDLLPPEMRAAGGGRAATATAQTSSDATATHDPHGDEPRHAASAASAVDAKPPKQQRAVPTGLLTVLTLIALALAVYAVLLSLSR